VFNIFLHVDVILEPMRQCDVMAKSLLKKLAALELFSCVSRPKTAHGTKKPTAAGKSARKSRGQPAPPRVTFDREFLEKYTVEEVIGRGGFGVVYAGTRNEDSKPVAIKVARKDKALGWMKNEAGETVPREVWCLQRVAHVDGVIHLVDYRDLRPQSMYILVMERPVRGQDLFDFIGERTTLSERQARDFTRQVVEMLEKVHAAGVVHRDVKDENIIVDLDTLTLRLVDFGSATHYKHSHYTDFDGTLVYSSPEWLLHRRYEAESYTVWTLGILLYDMVCGNIPFRTANGIIHASPTLPQQLSPEVRSLICRCLSAEPTDRPTLQQILTDPWMTTVDTGDDVTDDVLEQTVPDVTSSSSTQSTVSLVPCSPDTDDTQADITPTDALDDLTLPSVAATDCPLSPCLDTPGVTVSVAAG
jgi:serine/threonine protein kinase